MEDSIYSSVHTFTRYSITCQSISSVAVTIIAPWCVITQLSTLSTLCWVLALINIYVSVEVEQSDQLLP